MEEIELKGVKANLQTFSTLLKLCARGSLTKEAMALLNEMRSKNVHPNEFSYSTIIDGISKDDRLSDKEVMEFSNNVVSRMKQEHIPLDAHVYSNLINVALKIGDLSRAVGLFNEMKRKRLKFDAITYGTMIKCYAKLGDPASGDAYLKPCLDLFAECEQSGIVRTSEGYISLLSACANVANVDIASNVWSKIKEAKWKPDVCVCSAMIRVCLSADREDKALALLDEMKTYGVKPNEVTFRTFIAHFMKKKDRTGAQRIYNKMKSSGVKADKDILRMLKALRVS